MQLKLRKTYQELYLVTNDGIRYGFDELNIQVIDGYKIKGTIIKNVFSIALPNKVERIVKIAYTECLIDTKEVLKSLVINITDCDNEFVDSETCEFEGTISASLISKPITELF